MANPYFQFKKFKIEQHQSAMKVGTDAVLLGAWTDLNNSRKLLDIGTGTAILALMCAQRSENLQIDAIEIDKNSFHQAQENINNSLWNQRITAYHTSLQDFAPNTRYDLIICNPPYFINSQKNPNKSLSIARHTDSLSQEDLLTKSLELLSEKGRLNLILPVPEAELFIKKASQKNLHLTRLTKVFPTPHSTPKRYLMEFSGQEKNFTSTTIILEIERHIYHDSYKNLTKDFYLHTK